PPTTPDGKPYEKADDTAIITLVFANGAQGVIHVSTMGVEETPVGMSYHMEFHGSEGTLYSTTDFDRVQRVSGARVGEGMLRELPIPDHIWAGASREPVMKTFEDVFFRQDLMTRRFITAITTNTPIKPDFHDGTY